MEKKANDDRVATAWEFLVGESRTLAVVCRMNIAEVVRLLALLSLLELRPDGSHFQLERLARRTGVVAVRTGFDGDDDLCDGKSQVMERRAKKERDKPRI
jgi:predicted RNA binding protein YcfA (HicA-like mRNA interferase family)